MCITFTSGAYAVQAEQLLEHWSLLTGPQLPLSPQILSQLGYFSLSQARLAESLCDVQAEQLLEHWSTLTGPQLPPGPQCPPEALAAGAKKATQALLSSQTAAPDAKVPAPCLPPASCAWLLLELCVACRLQPAAAGWQKLQICHMQACARSSVTAGC